MKSRIRDVVGSTLFRSGLTVHQRNANERLTIVTFHRVLPDELRRQYPYPGLAVSPDELRWFLRYFLRYYDCVTLADACVRWPGVQGSRPLLVVTFDDGQLDNLDFGAPILAELGVPATFFVTVQGAEQGEPLWHDRIGYFVAQASEAKLGELWRRCNISRGKMGCCKPQMIRELIDSAKCWEGERRKQLISTIDELSDGLVVPDWDGFMTFRQLRKLIESGHEIGSHTCTHALLSNCSDETLESEICKSRSILSTQLNVSVESFCYPNGNYDDRSCEMVERAGYGQAVVTEWGSNLPAENQYRLKRFDMVAKHVQDRLGRLSTHILAWRMSGLYPGLSG